MRTHATIGELEEGGAAIGAGLHQREGALEVGVMGERHQASTDHGGVDVEPAEWHMRST